MASSALERSSGGAGRGPGATTSTSRELSTGATAERMPRAVETSRKMDDDGDGDDDEE